MLTSRIFLYFLRFNKNSLSYEILSKDQYIISIPNKIIENTDQSIRDILHYISREHLLIAPDLLQYKVSDVELVENSINIYYYTMVPHTTLIHNCYPLNINYNEPYPQNLSKILRLL